MNRAMPKWLPVDLIGQAEHGPGSPAVLLTTSAKLADEVPASDREVAFLAAHADVARIAWSNAAKSFCATPSEGGGAGSRPHRFRARAGPDRDPEYFLANLTNFGALFLGPRTNVSFGDKVIAPITRCRP